MTSETDTTRPGAHRLGWIGIGRMGFPMAQRLAKAGCDIAVWNRTRSKAEQALHAARWSLSLTRSPAVRLRSCICDTRCDASLQEMRWLSL